MPQAIKLIWRLDYDVSYAYLDRRGSALATLNVEANLWEKVGEGAVSMSFVARTENEGHMRNISVEPTCLNGAIEWRQGTELKKVLEDRSFRGTNRVVEELAKVCEIRMLKRAGIRFFCVDRYADGKAGGVDRFSALIDQRYLKDVGGTLGKLEDLAFVFEGVTSDKISYRAHFGPFAKKNVEQVLEAKPSDDLKALGEQDLFFDIDLFETNISFVEHSLFRWAKTKVEKADAFIAKCRGEQGQYR
jgi:hypothetical protein